MNFFDFWTIPAQKYKSQNWFFIRFKTLNAIFDQKIKTALLESGVFALRELGKYNLAMAM